MNWFVKGVCGNGIGLKQPKQPKQQNGEQNEPQKGKLSVSKILFIALVLLLVLLPPSLSAQQTSLPVSIGPIVTSFNTIAANAPYRVCLITSIGSPCDTTGVTIYSDSGLTHPINNPNSANSQGIINFFIPLGSYYQMQVTPTPGVTYQYYSGASSTIPVAALANSLSGGVTGSLPFQSAPNTTAMLAPNITTTRKFVMEQGTGTGGLAPFSDIILSSDLTSPLQTLFGQVFTSIYPSLNAAGAACVSSCSIVVNNATTQTGNFSSTAVVEVTASGSINQGAFTYSAQTHAAPTQQIFLGSGAATTPGNYVDYAGWWGVSTASSDNTAAANTASIAAAAIKIPLIFLPSSSSYRFNGTITPPNNSIMQCNTIHAGLNAWGVPATGCIFDFHLTNSVGFLLQNNLYNVKIQGFEFSGKNSTGTSDGMNLGNDPSGATTVQQVYILDNIFRDWPRYAVHHTGNVFEVWYERNTMENPDNASSDFMHVDSHTNSQIYLTDDVFLNFTDGTWAWNDTIGTTDLIVTRGIVSSSNAAAASGFSVSGGISLFGTHFEGGSKDGGVNPTAAIKIVGDTNGGQIFPSAVGGYNIGLWNNGTSVGITAGGPINGLTYALLNDHGCQRCILTSDPGGVINDTAGSSANRWVIPSLLIQATNPNTFTAIQTITLGTGSGVAAGSGMGLFVNSNTAIGMEVGAASGQQAYIDQCVGTNCWRHLNNPTDNTFRHFYNGVSKFVFDTSGNFNAVGDVRGASVTPGSSHLNQIAANDFAGSCSMSTSTSCTITLVGAYSGTPVCVTSPQGVTAMAGSCSVSGTTVTITAASSNSLTWGAILVGNPN